MTRKHTEQISPVELLSPAQRCNDDVLREIVLHLSRQVDIANACLVCRGWVTACRQELYANITLKEFLGPFRPAPVHIIPCLARTLRASPLLRGFIRHLTINTRTIYQESGNRFDWIPLLASEGCLHTLDLTYNGKDKRFSEVWASTSPFITVKHVSLRHGTMDKGQMTLQYIFKIFPNAHSLILDMPSKYDPFIPAPVPSTIIQHFTINLTTRPVSSIIPVLSILAPSLTHFDIRLQSGDDDETPLIPIIPRMIKLVHLAILLPRRVPDSRGPFLDHIVPQLPHLRELSCPFGSWSSALLRKLPARMEKLWLGYFSISDLDPSTFEGMIGRASAGEFSLKELYLIEPMPRAEAAPVVEQIEQACIAAGITPTRYSITNHYNALWAMTG